MAAKSLFALCIVLFGLNSHVHALHTSTDADILNFALNLEYLEATFYFYAAFGRGLNSTDRGGGPAPTGSAAGLLANLSPEAKQIATRIALDEIAHVRFLRKVLGSAAVPAPALDIGTAFATAANLAFGATLSPPFSPYASDVLFYHGAFIFEDVGVTAYKGAARFITNKDYLEAAAGILAAEAYHAGAIRDKLFEIRNEFVFPYGVQVRTIVQAIANLRASASGKKDDFGLAFGGQLVIAPGDANAIAFSRNTSQVLSIVYLGGKGKGGFFPKGLNGSVK